MSGDLQENLWLLRGNNGLLLRCPRTFLIQQLTLHNAKASAATPGLSSYLYVIELHRPPQLYQFLKGERKYCHRLKNKHFFSFEVCLKKEGKRRREERVFFVFFCIFFFLLLVAFWEGGGEPELQRRGGGGESFKSCLPAGGGSITFEQPHPSSAGPWTLCSH